jgi:hypothetical protein
LPPFLPLQKVVDQLKSQVAAEQARRRAEKEAEAAKKVALKAMLEQQMKINATHRIVAPMSNTEKKINAGLLKQVDMAVMEGTLGRGSRAGQQQRQQTAGKLIGGRH